MKTLKVLVFLPIISLCISLAGCGFLDRRNDDIRYHRSENFVRDAIIEALDNQDEAALKSLFSNDTIAQAADIDEKIKEYIEFYKGSFIAYASQSGSSSGMVGNKFNHWYIITTDEDEYSIYFEYISWDEEFEKENKKVVSDKIGLHAIVILRKELADEIVYNPWPPSDGVFILYTMNDYYRM